MPKKDRKLYDKLRRQRIKSDPELLKLWKERLHEDYVKKKVLGRIKLASQMSDHEKLEQRQKWKKTALSYRRRKKANHVNDDYPLEDEPLASVEVYDKEIGHLATVEGQSPPVSPTASTNSSTVAQTEERGENGGYKMEHGPSSVNIRSESIVSASNIKVEMHEQVLVRTCTPTPLTTSISDTSSGGILPVVMAETNEEVQENIMESSTSITSTVSGQDRQNVAVPPPSTINKSSDKSFTSIKIEINQNDGNSEMNSVFDSKRVDDELPEVRTKETESLQSVSEKSPTILKYDELNTQVTDLTGIYTKSMMVPGISRSKAVSTSAALCPATCETEEQTSNSSDKRVTKLWSPITMAEAVEAVRNKEMSVTNVPKKRRKLNDRKQCLPEALENELVSFCLFMERAFISLTRKELAKWAYDLAKKRGIQTQFNEEYQMAGQGWINRFLNKHKNQLPILESTKVAFARNGGVFKEAALFFDRMESIMDQTHLPPHRQYNVYECGLGIAQVNKVEILRLLGERQVKSLSVTGKETLVVIMMVCMNAVDDFVPPLVILPGATNSEEMRNGAPPGTVLRTDKTDWIKTDIFLQWLRHFIHHTRPSQCNPLLLTLDGSYSHLHSMEVVDLARENSITIVSLPMTPKMQPVDRTFMFPFRSYFRKELRRIVILNKRALTYLDVMGPFGIAYTKCQTSKIASYGFEVCGLYPLDRSKFDDNQSVARTKKGMKTVDNDCQIGEQEPWSLSSQEETPVETENTTCAAEEPTESDNVGITSCSDESTNTRSDTKKTLASMEQKKPSGAADQPTVIKQQTVVNRSSSSDMQTKLVNVKQENASSAADQLPICGSSPCHLSTSMGEPLPSHPPTNDSHQVKEPTSNSSDKRVTKLWSPMTMAEAVEAVRNKKMSVKSASEFFKVPRSTLRRLCLKAETPVATNVPKKRRKLNDRKQCLPEALENELVSFCLFMERAFISLTRKELAKWAYDLAKKRGIQTRFNEEYQMAGKGWINRFLNKHKNQLPILNSTKMAFARNGGVFKEAALFFDRMESIMDQTHLPPHRQYNVYECGLAIAQVDEVEILRLLGERQVKSLSVKGEGTLVVIMMVCMNAVDDFVPPLVILPGATNSEEMRNGAPPGTVLRTDKTDWIKTDIFLQWLRHFIHHTRPSQCNPLLLTLDGSYSHLRNMEVVDLARENSITIVSLPMTPKMQPIDKTFMFPFRSYFREELRRIVILNKRALTYLDVMGPFGIAYTKCQTSKIASYGFEVCGLYPLDRSKFDDNQSVARTKKGMKTVNYDCQIGEQEPWSLSSQEETPVETENTTCAADEPTESDNVGITSCSDESTNIRSDTKKTLASMEQKKPSGAADQPTVIKEQTAVNRSSSSDMQTKLVNVKQENAFSAADQLPNCGSSPCHLSTSMGEPLLSHPPTDDSHQMKVNVKLENTSCTAAEPPVSRPSFSCLTLTNTSSESSPSCSSTSELQKKSVNVKQENTSCAAAQPPVSTPSSCQQSTITLGAPLPCTPSKSDKKGNSVTVKQENTPYADDQPTVSKPSSCRLSTITSKVLSTKATPTSMSSESGNKKKPCFHSGLMMTAEVMKWTKEMTTMLIELYRGFECLWNKNSSNYRNRPMKSQAVIYIAQQVGVHSEEILRKLHNLRCQLNSEIRKVVRKRREGVNYTSAWDLFDTLLFMSDTEIPPVSNVPRPHHTPPQNPVFNDSVGQPKQPKVSMRTYQKYQIAVVKKEVLDELIEVKYEGVEETDPLYPFVQLDTSPEEHQIHDHDSSEPPYKRQREDGLDDCLLDEVECLTTDVFVDNPMADDAEDDARAFGDYVAAEMSRIRSDERRKAVKKTIEEAIKAMVQEDEHEYFQDPDVDPLS